MARGKKVLGVEYAPLDIPWERRMETLAVFLWINSFFLIPLGLGILFYTFFYTRFAFLSVLYLAFYLSDKQTCNRGGRRSEWVRRWTLWKRYCNYFPIKVVKTAELDPSKNYLVGSHPHGVLCSGVFGALATEALGFSKHFPKMIPHLLTLESLYLWPLYREYIMLSGACSASKDSINHLLGRPEGGHMAILIPGGAPESLDSHPDPDVKVHLQKRKGFIKMAIRNGVPLVPSFSFGETEIYDQISNPRGSKFRWLQDWILSQVGFAPVIVLGRGLFQYTFGLLPHRKPITVVVGAPIETVRMNDPTQEEIDRVHGLYVDALVALFNKHKAEHGNKNGTISII